MGKNKLLQTIAKIMNPHLSKAIGSNRPPAIYWKDDPKPIPPHHPFTKLSSGNKIEELIKKKQEVVDLRRPFRILCLDGGGVRGVLTSTILLRICRHHPTFLDEVDFIAGTSAGGLLTLLLSSGYSAEECHSIYNFGAPHIFGHNPWRSINPWRAKYSDKAKQEICQYYMGDRKMGDLDKLAAVVAFRLDGRKSRTHSFFNKEGWRPAVFSNMPKAAGLVEPDLDLFAWDAAMRTSAAPTYFPVYRGYTDGGIVANNPSIIAVSRAMAHFPHLNPKNISLLSIGAGHYPRHTNVYDSLSFNDDTPLFIDGQVGEDSLLNHADWGIRQWLPFLLDLLIDGDNVTTEMVMQYLLAGNNLYHRLDPRLPKNFSLDDVTSMKEIEDFAMSLDLTQTFNFVDRNFTYDSKHFDNEIHNSLDQAGNYHDAWAHMVSLSEMAKKR